MPRPHLKCSCNYLHRRMQLYTVVYLTLALCLTVSEAQYLTSFLSGNLLYNHQPYFSRYQSLYQPQYQTLFRPQFDASLFRQPYPSFLGSSFQPVNLPNPTIFPALNVTTISPGNNAEETTSPTDSIEVTTPTSPLKLKEDISNDTGTLVSQFSDFFKQTSTGALPLGYNPYNQIFASTPAYYASTPVGYSNIYDNKIALQNQPIYNNFLMDLIYRNDISPYGLPGFRPFFYNPSLLNSTHCSDNSTENCNNESVSSLTRTNLQDTTPDKNGLLAVISRLYKPDQNLVIFNTKDIPMHWTSDETLNIDPRSETKKDVGKKDAKIEEDPFYKIYKDIMFLNKSYLSTFAPYFHKH